MFIHIKQEGSALMSLKSMAGTLPSAGGTQSNSKTQEHGNDGRSDGEVSCEAGELPSPIPSHYMVLPATFKSPD